MATLSDHSSTNKPWKLPLTPTAAGTKTYTLSTADTYVDQDITVVETIAAGALQGVGGNAPVATVGLADTTYLTTTADGNYGPITATADAAATSKTGVSAVKTSGWIAAGSTVTVTTPAATQASTTKYVKAGALKAGSGSAAASGTGVTLGTKTTTQPTSGKYITVTGSGSTGVQTAGWIPASATQSSSTATAYYPITAATYNTAAGNAPVATAGFGASDDLTTTNTGFPIVATADAAKTSKSGVDIINVAGWADANGSTTVTTPAATQATATKYIVAGTLANAGTTGVTYTDATDSKGVALVSGDYLYINRGMFDNIKISLAKLVPDGSNIKGSEAFIYKNKTAYDNDGALVTGSMADAAISSSVTSASASASITSITPTYNSTSGKYDVSGSGSITGTAYSSASVSTSGLAVSSTDVATGGKYNGMTATTASGSKSISGTASLSGVTLNKATLKNTKGTDGTVTPVIKVDSTNNNAAVGTLTTTKPSSGNYVAVNTSAISASTTVTAAVNTAGYADSNVATVGATVTRGAAAAATAYVPLTAAAYNGGTASFSGPTYDSTNGNFTLTASGNGTIKTQGYTGAANSATGTVSGTKTLSKIEVKATKGTDGAVTPVISTTTAAVTNKTQVAATATTATTDISKYYIAVNTAAISASTTVTPGVKTAGYGDTTNYTSAGNVTVTRGAAASGTYYLPLATGGHSIGTNGSASSTNATAKASISGAGGANTDATYYGSTTPLLTSKPSTGAYIEISGSGSQTAQGSLSIPLKCTATAGYVEAGNTTYTAQGNVGVTVSAADKKYIKVFDGSYSVA